MPDRKALLTLIIRINFDVFALLFYSNKMGGNHVRKKSTFNANNQN